MTIQCYEHIDRHGNLYRRVTLDHYSREFTITRQQLEQDGRDFVERRTGYEISLLESTVASGGCSP